MTTDLGRLSDAKRELLEILLQEEHEPQAFPLSLSQRGLWFLDQLEQGGTTYVLPAAFRLTGRLHDKAHQRALDEIVRRHEALRVTFSVVEGEPVQVLAPALSPAVPRVDLRALPGRRRETEALRLAEADSRRPFNLRSGPLLRVTLLRLADDEHAVLFAMHHIVSDAWSLGVLVRELATLYAAYAGGRPSPLPELPLQYLDYVEWQRDALTGDLLDTQLAYWRERLEGAPALDLSTDRRRPLIQGSRGASVVQELPAGVAGGVRALCRRHGTTVFMTLLAAFEALLHRYTGQDDLVVGTTIANRRHSELEGLIGLFVNTLALRADLSGDPPFRELLARVRRSTLEAYAHQDLPFERLVGELGGKRDLSRSPLFQVLFQVQNAPASSLDLPGLTLSPLEMANETTTFDLVVSAWDTPQVLAISWKLNVDLFDVSRVERMAGHFATLLAGVVADEERRLSELPLLTGSERHQILVEWGAPVLPVLEEAFCLHERFEARAAATPEADAVTFGGERMSYGELNRRANRLAHHLRALGIGPGSLVGLCLERSLDTVAAILGVLKAGGAYLPLDPAYPPERLAFALEDSRAAVLVTETRLAPVLPGQLDARTVLLDGVDVERIGREREDNPGARTAPEDPAYVIYTSGSTGRPKGVLVSHANVARLFTSTDGWFGFGPDDVWTLFHSYSFDFSVWEIWGALLYGGRLVVVPYAVSRSPEDFLALLRRERVTVLNQTPSAFYQLARTEERAPAQSDLSLRLVVFGGEALEIGNLRPWFERYGDRRPRLVNMYGITETTVHVTGRPLRTEDLETAGRSVIGCPIPDLRLRVLDPWLQPVPIGVPGEVYVGGAGVAAGYLGRPELTAERFLPDPSGAAGERLYRTGDLAVYLPDGDLEYLGRIDHQVKVRGFRIELGEIEAALAAHPAVQEAVVAAHGEDGAERRLVAYVVPRPAAGITLSEARELLARTLPDHMLPAALVTLDRLPLTPSGKVDRRALPAPAGDRTGLGREYAAPRTELERSLVDLWREVLRIDRVGLHDDFFEMGGNSISAALAANRLQEELGAGVPVVAFFEAPTPAALAAWLLRSGTAHEAEETASGPIPADDWRHGGTAPASFAQERLWFLDQLEPGTATYNIPTAVRLTGALDPAALRLALEEIARRHATLRTTFTSVDGQPFQVIAPALPFALPAVELTGLPPAEREAEARKAALAEARRPFDLTRGPLVRAALLRLAPEEHAALFTMHHIVSDGWSMGILVREMAALYAAFLRSEPSPLPEPPIQYADFALWQRDRLSGERVEAELGFWRSTLAGAPALELPADRPRPPIQGHRGASRGFVLPPGLASELTALGQDLEGGGATLFMTLTAVFLALLHRLSGQEDVSVGTPVAGRSSRQLEGLIGFFVNTLVLRVDASGDPGFRELLGRVRRVALQAYAHQELPFERIVEALQPERDPSRPPLFQVMLAFENAAAEPLSLPGLALSPLAAGTGTAKFDLTLALVEAPGGIGGSLEYNVDLFDAATAERLIRHLKTLLEDAVAAAPGLRLSELPLLSKEESQQLLVEWSWTRADYEPSGLECLHDMVAAQAARTPDRIAVEGAGWALTYDGLEERAHRVARYLRRIGVRPEDRVGLYAERSAAMIVGMLGILQCGAAYVPLDPEQPSERLAFMLANSGAVALLAQEGLPLDLPGATAHGIETALSAGGDGWGLAPPSAGDGLAYVIYTSGSTGTPKGVMVPHRAIRNRLVWMQASFPVGDGDRVLQKTPFSFDASIWEIFVPLLAGARLVMARPGGHRETGYLVRVVEELGITVLQLVPSMLQVLLEEEGVERCAGLRRMFCGGEALPSALARRFFGRLPETELHNLYGPTEAAIDAAHRVCEPGEDLPGIVIGRPLGNLQIHILDRSLRPCPLGVPGELHIGGVNLARGYIARPDLTAEKFIPHPFSAEPGERLYRSGDLARLGPDGRIEFLGRIDAQVKIRGVRIEPGEVEAALARHAEVLEAAVVAREDLGDKRLVAYVVFQRDGEARSDSLREALARELPDAMVPSAFVVLPALPRLPNGKLDRRSLPAPSREHEPAGDHQAPRGPVEELIAGLWRELLAIARVDRHDDFFLLGGHSLLATRLASRLRQVFAVDLSLRTLFQAPTVAGLAGAVEEARQGGDQLQGPPIEPEPRDVPLPVSFAQQRLWFLDQLEPGSSAYNLPLAVRLAGRLDAAVLAATFREIVRRHESLRTRFQAAEGLPVQEIDPPPAKWTLPVTDLSGLPPAAAGREVERLAREEAMRPFDLARGPLLRASLARLGGEEHALLATMHHIVSDGWSTGILVREIAVLYKAFAAGHPSPLPELPVQYADFAAWQRRRLSGELLEAQLEHWRGKLAGSAPALELPTDRPRPEVPSVRGARQPLWIETSLVDLGRREGATLFMVLLAAFQTLLHRYSGQDDVLVGTPVANRTRPELEPLIGFFVNTLVLRSDLSGNPLFRGLLSAVRETALDAWDHQEVPFEQLVEVLRPGRDVGRNPLFQVMLVLQNAPMGTLELPDLELRPQPVGAGAAKFDMTLELVEAPERVGGLIEYDADLFDAPTMSRFARHFEALLREVARNPGQRIEEIDILDEAERLQVLAEWNDAGTLSTDDELVPQLITARAARQPEAAALVWSGGSMTYAELRARAGALAYRLRGLGVGPEALVAVCCERSPGLVVAALAVLEAGGAYLPLDPAQPVDRLRYILEDAGRPLLVTEETLLPLFPEEAQALVLDGSVPSDAPESIPPVALDGDSLAYVIYTSGSTGRPKGTLLTHRGFRVMAEELARWHGLHPGARQLQFSSASFDASVAEIFTALVAGAELHLAPIEEMLPGSDLVRTLRDRAITTAVLPPSALLATPVEDLPDLTTLVVAGEACPPDLVRSWGAGRRFLNGYGPTETTVCVSIGLPEPGDSRAPIGWPVAGARLYLLNPALEPVPAGVAGELCVAGPGLARGYLGRPDLSAERFIPDPFSSLEPIPGGRLYRTGDRVRRRPDGQLEFLGRIDQQVKVRGFRVEVEEVEAALAAQPAVRMAAVAARPDASGIHRLVGYVVPAGEGVNVSELRASLRRELPEYMMPSVWVTLEALPLTPSGKVDRRALPEPAGERPDLGEGYAAPRGPVEEVLADLWSKLLGIGRVGAHDDFFELGGHSLLATQVVSRVRKLFKVELPLREFFGATTVAALADLVRRHEAKPGQTEAIARAVQKIASMSADEVRGRLQEKRSGKAG